jgi:hypothetical protein
MVSEKVVYTARAMLPLKPESSVPAGSMDYSSYLSTMVKRVTGTLKDL